MIYSWDFALGSKDQFVWGWGFGKVRRAESQRGSPKLAHPLGCEATSAIRMILLYMLHVCILLMPHMRTQF